MFYKEWKCPVDGVRQEWEKERKKMNANHSKIQREVLYKLKRTECEPRVAFNFV
jgi:hypothetical protein